MVHRKCALLDEAFTAYLQALPSVLSLRDSSPLSYSKTECSIFNGEILTFDSLKFNSRMGIRFKLSFFKVTGTGNWTVQGSL